MAQGSNAGQISPQTQLNPGQLRAAQFDAPKLDSSVVTSLLANSGAILQRGMATEAQGFAQLGEGIGNIGDSFLKSQQLALTAQKSCAAASAKQTAAEAKAEAAATKDANILKILGLGGAETPTTTTAPAPTIPQAASVQGQGAVAQNVQAADQLANAEVADAENTNFVTETATNATPPALQGSTNTVPDAPVQVASPQPQIPQTSIALAPLDVIGQYPQQRFQTNQVLGLDFYGAKELANDVQTNINEVKVQQQNWNALYLAQRPEWQALNTAFAGVENPLVNSNGQVSLGKQELLNRFTTGNLAAIASDISAITKQPVGDVYAQLGKIVEAKFGASLKDQASNLNAPTETLTQNLTNKVTLDDKLYKQEEYVKTQQIRVGKDYFQMVAAGQDADPNSVSNQIKKVDLQNKINEANGGKPLTFDQAKTLGTDAYLDPVARAGMANEIRTINPSFDGTDKKVVNTLTTLNAGLYDNLNFTSPDLKSGKLNGSVTSGGFMGMGASKTQVPGTSPVNNPKVIQFLRDTSQISELAQNTFLEKFREKGSVSEAMSATSQAISFHPVMQSHKGAKDALNDDYGIFASGVLNNLSQFSQSATFAQWRNEQALLKVQATKFYMGARAGGQ